MRVERRQGAPRVRFSVPLRVRILAIDGTWCREGLLVDASDTGARLEVEGSTAGAKEFFLMLSFNSHPAFRRCKMVWVNGNQVGVAFDRQHVADPEAKRRSRERSLEAA
jgi:hypothetical protein